MKPGAVILLLFLTACGQARPGTSLATTPPTIATPTPLTSTTATPDSTPSATPTVAAMATSSPAASGATRLFVIAEGNPSCHQTACKVAIVDSNGHVRARRTFNPLPQAVVGCEGSWIVAHLQVVGNSAYYLDDSGTVHRLLASGGVTEVAHLPVRTTQQVSWFAVSPDGSQGIAALMVYTPLSPSWDPQRGCPTHEAGRVHEEIDLVAVGGSTKMLSDQTNPPQVTSVVGWDRTGPIAVPDSHMAYIGYIDGTIWGGPAVHLDLHGQRAGGWIGGSSCTPFFGEVADGNLVCHDRKQPTVRDSAGNVLWSLKALDPTDDFSYGMIALSPDASHVAFSLNSKCCYTFDSSVVRGRDGVRIGLGSAFQPQGWLDDQTIIGARGSVKPTCPGCPPDFVPSTLGIIDLAHPTDVRDLGISGTFLGVLQGP